MANNRKGGNSHLLCPHVLSFLKTSTAMPRYTAVSTSGALDCENNFLQAYNFAILHLCWFHSADMKRLMRRRSTANTRPASPSEIPKNTPSPGKRKRETVSGSSSSLSEASPLPSPSTVPPPLDHASARATPLSTSSSDDARQPPPAASIAQYQTFGPNPLTFDDPTCYEVLPVTDHMTDEDKKEIYCVSSFPHDDLHDLIAGTPPNRDFSNAVKPNNQTAPHTFLSYLENYVRPLKEEDIGFLNERVSFRFSIVAFLTLTCIG